ncbi:MAG: N-6 DNA methylase [Gammaproteobacteria bacterium]|nr:N-6 DNA methylase [Gammaproteobacteria bacterium]
MPGLECELAATAAALAGPEAILTASERAIVTGIDRPSRECLQQLRRSIERGEDPLGSAFRQLRPAKVHREQGAIYTPRPIIEAMVNWAAERTLPTRIVDPGAGSGRFLLAAGKAFPDAELIAVEIDPLAALTLRANASALKLAGRLTVLVDDYREINLPKVDGPTLFLGNPPYVRHHGIAARWKDWFADAAASRGMVASKLAGLHVHFFLKTLLLARSGDYGAFITSAEWLDVNYGDLMRKLLVNGLGGTDLHVISPAAMPFADAATTGVITCFQLGHNGDGIRFRFVDTLDELGTLPGGREVPRARLEGTRRWTPLLVPRTPVSQGHIELGELCRVHRGQVTGCNAVWIAGESARTLPEAVLFPSVTRARELFEAGTALSDTTGLRRVVDLPSDLDSFTDEQRRQVQRFLAWAKRNGAKASYIARHRRAWWSVKLTEPAPILCTYMARRPPAFVRNLCGARHLNIAHGIYPRDPLPAPILDVLSAWLQHNVCLSDGRTYAGGLTKFEPRELERVPIPTLEELNERA